MVFNYDELHRLCKQSFVGNITPPKPTGNAPLQKFRLLSVYLHVYIDLRIHCLVGFLYMKLINRNDLYDNCKKWYFVTS